MSAALEDTGQPAELPPRRLTLTPDEAADELRIGRTMIYELVATSSIPVVRIGRLVRIPRAALEAWLEERTEQPGRRGR